MKKSMYIPGGETANYENLTCKHITVDGELRVNGTLTADTIGGVGVVSASFIRAKTLRADIIDAGTVIADTVFARQIYATEVRALNSVTASSFIETGLLKSAKVVIADAEIEDLQADEITKLPAKEHSILGALVLSFLRSVWLSLVGAVDKNAMAENIPEVTAETADDSFVPEPAEESVPEPRMSLELEEALELLKDPKFRRLIAMSKLEKRYGGKWVLNKPQTITAEDFTDAA